MFKRAGQVLKCNYCRRIIKRKELYVKREDGTNECGRCYLALGGFPLENHCSKGKVSLSLSLLALTLFS